MTDQNSATNVKPRIALPERTPDDENPWGDDLLGRTKYGDALQAAVAEFASKGASILLDGGYGTGKTFILERWAHDLRKENIPVRHYNAWEHDGDEDPLVSLVECLTDAQGVRPYDLGAVAEDVIWQAVKLVARVDLQSALAKGQGDGTPDLRKMVTERRQASQNLRDGLTTWVHKAKAQYAVVIIDELDRCRPAFALRVMERVKHVLKTPGVAFVFGASRDALSQSHLHEHGQGNDAEGYFLRMFDCQLALPLGVFFDESHAQEQVAKEYVQGLAQRHNLDAGVGDMPSTRFGRHKDHWGTQTLPMLRLLASRGRMTPRELEKAMQALTVSVAMAKSADGKRSVFKPFVFLPMVMAALKRPDAYHRMLSEPNRGAEVINIFSELLNEQRTVSGASSREKQVHRVMDFVEISLYYACRSESLSSSPAPIRMLEAIHAGKKPPAQAMNVLADRSHGISPEQADQLLNRAPSLLNIPEEDDLLRLSFVRHWADRLNMIRLRD